MRTTDAGFSLVEVMVGLVIGLIAMLVMVQMISFSSAHSDTTTAGNDAMNEGAIALYALQSELGMAGYGLSDLNILGCRMALPSGASVNVAPVTINPLNITGLSFSRAAATDAMIVMYAKTHGAPLGDLVTGSGNVVQTASAFAIGDWVVATPATRGATCNLSVDRIQSINSSNNSLTLTSGAALATGSRVFNLGQSFRVAGFAVFGSDLMSCDYTVSDCSSASNWSAVASNIVSMRLQYGHDTTATSTMNGAIGLYDQVNPDLSGTTNTACNWMRIPGLRLALVARSAQQAPGATRSAPLWDGQFAGNPSPASTATPIDLSASTTWQNYRYKVFQAAVPLRNITWIVSDPSWLGRSLC